MKPQAKKQQLLDEVFVITLTETLIILDITKTEVLSVFSLSRNQQTVAWISSDYFMSL